MKVAVQVRARGPRQAQAPELRRARRQHPEGICPLERGAVVVGETDVDRVDDPGIDPVGEDLQLEEAEIVGRVDVEGAIGGSRSGMS